MISLVRKQMYAPLLIVLSILTPCSGANVNFYKQAREQFKITSLPTIRYLETAEDGSKISDRYCQTEIKNDANPFIIQNDRQSLLPLRFYDPTTTSINDKMLRLGEMVYSITLEPVMKDPKNNFIVRRFFRLNENKYAAIVEPYLKQAEAELPTVQYLAKANNKELSTKYFNSLSNYFQALFIQAGCARHDVMHNLNNKPINDLKAVLNEIKEAHGLDISVENEFTALNTLAEKVVSNVLKRVIYIVLC